MIKFVKVLRQAVLLGAQIVDQPPHQYTDDEKNQGGHSGFKILAHVERGMALKILPDPYEVVETGDEDHAQHGNQVKAESSLENGDDGEDEVGAVFVVGEAREQNSEREIQQDRGPGQQHQRGRRGSFFQALQPDQLRRFESKSGAEDQNLHPGGSAPIRREEGVEQEKSGEQDQIQDDEDRFLTLEGNQIRH